MKTTQKIGLTAATLAAAGAMIAGGAAISNASPESASQAAAGYAGYGADGTSDRGPGGPGGKGAHTPVTGAEATKVTDAVKAKDAAVTVERVMKNADGAYHVHGTKAGKQVRVEVSKDLKTIEVRTAPAGGPGRHGGPGGPGGPGKGAHTAVTGAEATKVTAAVKAKDSAVTVERVMKDADGSYDVHGTKAGNHVMVEVSKDLKTIEVRTGGPGGPAGHGPAGERPAPGAPAPSGAPSAPAPSAPAPSAPATSGASA